MVQSEFAHFSPSLYYCSTDYPPLSLPPCFLQQPPPSSSSSACRKCRDGGGDGLVGFFAHTPRRGDRCVQILHPLAFPCPCPPWNGRDGAVCEFLQRCEGCASSSRPACQNSLSLSLSLSSGPMLRWLDSTLQKGTGFFLSVRVCVKKDQIEIGKADCKVVQPSRADELV